MFSDFFTWRRSTIVQLYQAPRRRIARLFCCTVQYSPLRNCLTPHGRRQQCAWGWGFVGQGAICHLYLKPTWNQADLFLAVRSRTPLPRLTSGASPKAYSIIRLTISTFRIINIIAGDQKAPIAVWMHDKGSHDESAPSRQACSKFALSVTAMEYSPEADSQGKTTVTNTGRSRSAQRLKRTRGGYETRPRTDNHYVSVHGGPQRRLIGRRGRGQRCALHSTTGCERTARRYDPEQAHRVEAIRRFNPAGELAYDYQISRRRPPRIRRTSKKFLPPLRRAKCSGAACWCSAERKKRKPRRRPRGRKTAKKPVLKKAKKKARSAETIRSHPGRRAAGAAGPRFGLDWKEFRAARGRPRSVSVRAGRSPRNDAGGVFENARRWWFELRL